MKAHQFTAPGILRLAARQMAAALVALCLLAAAIPFRVASAGAIRDGGAPLCAMSCCAGLAPHPAGACSSAHASPHVNSSAGHAEESAPQRAPQESHDSHAEHIEIADEHPPEHHRSTAEADHHDRRPDKDASPLSSAHVSGVTVSIPCSPECVMSASGYSQSHHPDKSAAFASAIKPRPPSNGDQLNFANTRVRTLDVSCKLIRPRSPPASFS